MVLSAREVLRSRLIAAGCLQRLWRFTLSIYRPDQQLIPSGVADGTGLPSPDEDYGHPCLRALADRLAEQAPFPFNYEAQFSRVAELVIADLIAEANRAACLSKIARGTGPDIDDVRALARESLRVDEVDFRRKFSALLSLLDRQAGDESSA